MDVMVEFHSMWQLFPAIRIAKALGPFGSFWHEDPIKMDSLGSLKRYADASPAPVCASETLGTRWAFRDLLETGAPRESSCWISPGAAAFQRLERLPQWQKPGTCRLPRMIVLDR